MARPDPIQYAEHLYAAIRAANFSPISFLAFGNAIKDGVALRNMPRIAAEPFMRVVGEMLDLEDETSDDEIADAPLVETTSTVDGARPVSTNAPPDRSVDDQEMSPSVPGPEIGRPTAVEKRRVRR